MLLLSVSGVPQSYTISSNGLTQKKYPDVLGTYTLDRADYRTQTLVYSLDMATNSTNSNNSNNSNNSTNSTYSTISTNSNNSSNSTQYLLHNTATGWQVDLVTADSSRQSLLVGPQHYPGQAPPSDGWSFTVEGKLGQQQHKDSSIVVAKLEGE